MVNIGYVIALVPTHIIAEEYSGGTLASLS